MNSSKNNKQRQLKIVKNAVGLKGLESYLEHYTYLYVLRHLYWVVLKSRLLRENKKELRRRIWRFEKSHALPNFLSSAPLEQFLIQLEDAQYVYPIFHREITFQNFY